jgi:hypothetical protein
MIEIILTKSACGSREAEGCKDTGPFGFPLYPKGVLMIFCIEEFETIWFLPPPMILGLRRAFLSTEVYIL